MVEPAARIQNVRYAIRNVVAEALKLEREGREILYCNVGDPLKFDFVTPPHLVEAVHKAMIDGHNGYAPSPGLMQAREAVAADATARGFPGVSAEDVLITAGASEAIELTLTAMLEPGDSLLLPSPGYPLYNAVAAKLQVDVIPYHLDEAHGWSVDAAEVDRLVGPRTRAVVICNPNNPTGGLTDKAGLLKVLEVARRRRLAVLSDEIYDRLLYGAPHTPTATLAEDVPIITFNGLSKAYLACGWRVGWAIFSNRALTQALRGAALKLADARLCGPAPAQYAVKPALEGPQDHIAQMMGKLRERRDVTVRRLNAIPGLSCVEPGGAFYAMPRLQLPGVTDDERFVIDLLHETGVLFVHGSGFGQAPGTQHFRVVFLPPPAVLERAFDKLEAFVRAKAPRATG
ncbi:MAG TPA: aminotransferase class I/II-fold pyridoxal phosphate-dependent enzyme [Myxococcaceae bacterium]|nr:aminotransferase class I/II-fold pyridoxal phosphate-dependent enzyme [Myxococcaceae bacterium]